MLTNEDFLMNEENDEMTSAEQVLKMEADKLINKEDKKTQDDLDFNDLLPKFDDEKTGKGTTEKESDFDEDEWIATQNNLAKYLIQEGSLNVVKDLDSLPDELKSSKTLLKDLVSAQAKYEAQQAIKNSFPGWKDKEVADFIRAINNGASISDFAQYYGDIDYTKVDIRNKQVQEQLIRDNLETQGYNDNEIEEMVSLFRDTDQLEKSAKIAQRQLIEKQQRDQEEFQYQLEEQKKQEEIDYRNYLQNLDNFVKMNNTISGNIALTNEDKNIVQYLTDYEPVYTDENNKNILRDEYGEPVYMNSYEFALHNASAEEKLALQVLMYKFVLNGFKLNGQNLNQRREVIEDAKQQLLNTSKKLPNRNPMESTSAYGASKPELELLKSLRQFKSQNK